MKTVIRKFLSVFLSALLLITCVPAEVFAGVMGDKVFAVRYLEDKTRLGTGIFSDYHTKVIGSTFFEEGDIVLIFQDGYRVVKEMPKYTMRTEINGNWYYLASKESINKVITQGELKFGSSNYNVVEHMNEWVAEAISGKVDDISEYVAKQNKGIYTSLAEARAVSAEKRLLSIHGIYQTGKIDDLLRAAEILNEDMKSMNEGLLHMTNELNEPLGNLVNSFWNNGGMRYRKYLSDSIDEILNIYGRIRDVAVLLQKNSELSVLDRLANMYLPKELKIINPESVFLEFDVDPMVKELRALQEELKNMPNVGRLQYDPNSIGKAMMRGSSKQYKRIEEISEIVSKKFADVEHQLSRISRSAVNIDAPLIKFATEVEKKEFLKAVMEKVIKIAEESGNLELVAALKANLALKAGYDDVVALIEQMQRQMVVLSNEAARQSERAALALKAAKGGGKVYTIPEMMRKLNGLETAHEKIKLLREASSHITDPETQRLLNEVLEQDPVYAKEILASLNSGAASKVGRGVARKMLTISAAFLVGSWMTFAYIRSTNAITDKSRSVDMVAWVEDLKTRIRQNKASPQEVNSYFKSEYAKSEIADDPTLFAAYALMMTKTVTSPKTQEMYNDPVMVIEGWEPEGEDATPLLKQGLKGLKYREDSHKKGTNAA